MSLREIQLQQGAELAADGIPLRFGDLKSEYRAALESAVLMDRSHEGRVELSGRDRFNISHRISTNDLLGMTAGEGRPTIFTNANARILERMVIYHRGETALCLAEPGRGAALVGYLQRNVFFNDEMRVNNVSSSSHQFDLHGPEADAVIEKVFPGLTSLPPMYSAEAILNHQPVFVARNKPISGNHWVVVIGQEFAVEVWQAISDAGAVPAGSLTVNTLRIRAGRPGVGRELSQDYIPLEVGLWDEVSFKKGCYTGQEIIARMESRSRLAKTMVRLRLDDWLEAPADVFQDGKAVGRLTSSVVTADDEIIGIGVVKLAAAHPGERLTGANGAQSTVTDFAGTPPPILDVQEAREE